MASPDGTAGQMEMAEQARRVSRDGQAELLWDSGADKVDGLVTVDSILEQIGEFGPIQKRIWGQIAGCFAACSSITMMMVFVNGAPEWKDQQGNVYTDPVPCKTGEAFEMVENSHTIQQSFSLYCDRAWLASAVNSLYFVGFLFGSTFFGGICDSKGRKKGFVLACEIALAAGIASALAIEDWMYYIARGVQGFAIGGCVVATFVWSSEFIGPSYRGPTGIGSSVLFSLGNVVLVVVAYIIRPWRMLTIAISLQALLFTVLALRLPESPRWLQSVGRIDEANEVMQQIAAGNGKHIPAGMLLQDQSKKAGSEPAEPVSAKVLFQGLLLVRTVVMMYVWFANSFVFYGLSLSAGSLSGGVYLSFFLMSCVELAAYWPGTWLIDHIGRRLTLSGALIQASVCCALCSMITNHAFRATFAIAGKFGMAASFAIVFVYNAELYPTSVRSAAMGISSSASRVGGIVAPAMLTLAEVWQGLPVAAFGVAALLGGVAILALPETMGKPMAETLEDIQ